MPELPEVEITRLGLVDRLVQAQVTQVHLGKPLRWPLGVAPAQLVGQQVGEMVRRGKYLWMPLRSPRDPAPATAEGGDSAGLLLHLGMSGSLRFGSGLPERGLHDHFEMQTDRGTLRLTDPRRFGAVVWSPDLAAEPARSLLARLGVEPFSDAFTAEHLAQRFAGRRIAVKQALLAGDVVVGVGNIYCSEALFRAGIDPHGAAGDLSLRRCHRLVVAVRQVLQAALDAGGSTLRDFRDVHGLSGAFQDSAMVYGRAGEPCRVCATAVQRTVQGQRATYFCPRCQT
jgi:formamidopyrimidine-DNA glycosylase